MMRLQRILHNLTRVATDVSISVSTAQADSGAKLLVDSRTSLRLRTLFTVSKSSASLQTLRSFGPRTFPFGPEPRPCTPWPRSIDLPFLPDPLAPPP